MITNDQTNYYEEWKKNHPVATPSAPITSITEPDTTKNVGGFVKNVGEDVMALTKVPQALVMGLLTAPAHPIKTYQFLKSQITTPEHPIGGQTLASLEEIPKWGNYYQHPLTAAINTLAWLSVPFTFGSSHLLSKTISGAADVGALSLAKQGVADITEQQVKNAVMGSAKSVLGRVIQTGDTSLLKSRVSAYLNGYGSKLTPESIDKIASSVADHIGEKLPSLKSSLSTIDPLAHPFRTLVSNPVKALTKGIVGGEPPAAYQVFRGMTGASEKAIADNAETLSRYQDFVEKSMTVEGKQVNTNNVAEEWAKIVYTHPELKGDTFSETMAHFEQFAHNTPLAQEMTDIMGKQIVAGKTLSKTDFSAIQQTVKAYAEAGDFSNTAKEIVDDLAERHSILSAKKTEIMNAFQANPTPANLIKTLRTFLDQNIVPEDVIKANPRLTEISNEMKKYGYTPVYAPTAKEIVYPEMGKVIPKEITSDLADFVVGKQKDFEKLLGKQQQLESRIGKQAINEPYVPLAQRTKPIPTGSEAILNRLRLEQNFGNIPRQQVDTISRFIDGIGTDLFDDVGLSILKKGGKQGQYEYGQSLITLFKDNIFSSGGKFDSSTIHEMWHSLSRYLPEEDVKKVSSQFLKEKTNYIKSNPWFEEFLNNGKTLTKEQGDNLLKKYPEIKKYLDPINSEYNGKQIGWKQLFDDTNYRFKNLDEWFSETLTDKTFQRFSAMDKSVSSIFVHAKNVIRKMIQGIQEVFGGNKANKILNDFFNQKNTELVREGNLAGSMESSLKEQIKPETGVIPPVPLDPSYEEGITAKALRKSGLSPFNVGENMMNIQYEKKFNELAASSLPTQNGIVQLGKKFVPVDKLYTQLNVLRRIVGKPSVSDLTIKDLTKAGVNEKIANNVIGVVKKSLNIPFEKSGIGLAMINKLRSLPKIGNVYDKFFEATMKGHFTINPFFGARRIAKGQIFTSMKGVGLVLPESKFANLMRQIPYVKNIIAPEITMTDKKAYFDLVRGKLASQGSVDISNVADVLSWKDSMGIEKGMEANNVLEKWLGTGQAQQEVAIMKTLAKKNWGLTSQQLYKNPEAINDIVNVVKNTMRYRSGFESSPLIRSLNVLSYPVRFEYKVASRTAEWLSNLDPLKKIEMTVQMVNGFNYLQSDAGKQWTKNNAKALGVLSYFLPYEGIGKTIADTFEGKFLQGNAGYIGGLPFGFVMNIAKGLGLLPEQQFVDEYTGKKSTTPRQVPKQLFSLASAQVAAEALIQHIFPLSTYTVTGGLVRSIQTSYIKPTEKSIVEKAAKKFGLPQHEYKTVSPSYTREKLPEQIKKLF